MAIDPGNEQSGYVVYDGERVTARGVIPNAEMKVHVSAWDGPLAVEYIAGMGMSAGQSTFDTCVFIGRLLETYERNNWLAPILVKRKDVKMHLCGAMRAKDRDIRAELIDRFGGPDKAIGKKKTPGPLFGVSSHAWQALGVAVTAWETRL